MQNWIIQIKQEVKTKSGYNTWHTVTVTTRANRKLKAAYKPTGKINVSIDAVFDLQIKSAVENEAAEWKKKQKQSEDISDPISCCYIKLNLFDTPGRIVFFKSCSLTTGSN